MTLDFRNPVFNAAGTIDLEIDSPQFGWIPFTASPNDTTDYGREIYAEAIAGTVAPYVAPVIVPTVPDSVSARQFHVQLGKAGLRDQVAGWVAAQTVEVQDAYQYSGTFVRAEPMMQAGFTALGFTIAQIDAFFTAAAGL
jgi:hypothetical protein